MPRASVPERAGLPAWGVAARTLIDVLGAEPSPAAVVTAAAVLLRHQEPPPGDDWDTWVLLAGRGAGKTEAMARYARAHCVALGPRARVGVGAPTIADARDTCAEGVSGLISLFPDEFDYNRSLGEARHQGGGYVKFLGSEKPARWNGPQWSLLWWDELALCNVLAVEQSLFGLRLGTHPRMVASTTPKGSNFVRALCDEPATEVTRATTYDNPHLAERAVARLRGKYEGTRLGAQELLGEWLDDVPGALWQRSQFDERREAPDLVRVVIGVDPAVTSHEGSDETGIVVVGKGVDGFGYVLADRSCRLSPDGWARRVCAAYDEFACDRVVVEVNNGGDMLAHTLRTVRPGLPIETVHASRGKLTRAEPIAALYEQKRVWHVQPLPELEEQLCSWVPESGTSPDRLDACLVAGTEVATERGPVPIEAVTTADRVWTRDGWQRVLWAGQTAALAPVRTVTFANGAALRGTGSHPVWVEGRGFVALDALVCGDIIQAWNATSSGTTVSAIPASPIPLGGISAATGGRRVAVVSRGSTASYGKPLMVRFRRAITSIIAMGTRLTMPSTTCWPSLLPSMVPLMPRSSPLSVAPMPVVSGRSPWSGISLRPGVPGMSSMRAPSGPSSSLPQLSVLSVDARPSVTLPRVLGRTIAAAAARVRWRMLRGATPSPSPAPSAGRPSSRTNTAPSLSPAPCAVVGSYASGAAPVYNLTVANQPEFIANGVLVHNCVWACTALDLGDAAMPSLFVF